MLFLIRHGERADDSTNNEKAAIILNFDPHLSAQGQNQAKKTGKYIRNILKQDTYNIHAENKDDPLIIVTSPYLRCLQTSLGIAKQQEKPFQIYIAKGLGECFRKDWFDHDILDELHFYKKSQQYSEILNEYQLTIVPYEEVIQKYPEAIQEFFGRFSENFKRMRNHFKGKNIVVVTHGYGVHAINMFEKQIATFNAEYCCVNVIKYNGDNAEFLLHNSVAHLRKSKL